MHRATPVMTSFRAYTSGGARTVIHSIDDSKMMQEMGGNFMKGENRDKVESPQNYGFSSVVREATKDAQGAISASAEGFITFCGGSRSFPVCGIMDDRRHRPMGMKPGENAQYDDLGQMTLLRRAGIYLLSLDGPDDSQSSSGSGGSSGAGAGTLDTGGSSSGGGQGQTVQRFVSIRHVEKQKQQRPSGGSSGSGNGSGGSGGASAGTLDASSGNGSSGSSGGSSSDYKHEGDSVNHGCASARVRSSFTVDQMRLVPTTAAARRGCICPAATRRKARRLTTRTFTFSTAVARYGSTTVDVGRASRSNSEPTQAQRRSSKTRC